jgi:Homeodomain-like domain
MLCCLASKTLVVPRVSADDVDWETLSPEGRWIALELAWLLAEGKTQKAIAAELGVSPRKVRMALDELAEEIRAQVD